MKVINRVFDALDNCKLCGKHCSTGTARAEHARSHVRQFQAVEVLEPHEFIIIPTQPPHE